MKRLAATLALLLIPAAAAAGDSVFVVAAAYTPTLPPVRIQARADYVAVPIIVSTDSKNAATGSDDVERALKAVRERVRQHPGLELRTGVVSLAPREGVLGSLGSSAGYGGSSARLHVLTPLKDDNVFAATRRIHQALSGLRLEGSRLSFGTAVLGVDEPEKHRAQLLALVAKSVSDTRRALGVAGAAQLEGLEASVGVMQLNETDVVLWLGYRLRLDVRPPEPSAR
jgi:hypothetical protein